MTKSLIPMLMLCAFATSANAQDPFNGMVPIVQNQASDDPWQSQDPRYDTPKQAVRRKAAWKAAQRRQRLEGMKQLGYSPSRPPTSPLPFMSSPPRWVMAPAYYPGPLYYPITSPAFRVTY